MAKQKDSNTNLLKHSLFITIFCVVCISLFMYMVSSKLYKKEKFKEIESISDLFIGGVKDEFEVTNTMYSSNITKFHDGFLKNYGVSIYVYDSDRNCILSPTDDNSNQLSEDLKNRIDDDTVLDSDSHEISNKEPSILYGDRFYVKYGESQPQRMYLTVYSPTDNISIYNAKLIIAYIIIATACTSIAYIFLKRRARKDLNDLQNFLRISEKYSKGDFSEKLVIQTPETLHDITTYVNALASNMEHSEEKSQTFIANVSHELRTPITTIGGFVDGILDGTIPKSRQQEYLILVSKEIKRLRILITSMLNMTRFETGTLKPNFKETNLTELVIQTVLMFEKKIDDKKINIEGLDSDRLNAVVDADLMQQVIYNLVENAVKFVNVNGTLSFRFEKGNGMCLIGIKNTGEGLKNTEIQQVFDRFYKTDSSRGKDTTGLGLGLSISRKIVHLHNGHIIVKSVFGEYTEFAIQIPEKQK